MPQPFSALRLLERHTVMKSALGRSVVARVGRSGARALVDATVCQMRGQERCHLALQDANFHVNAGILQ